METCLLTVNNALGIGVHSALSTSSGGGEFYDPSGGYGIEQKNEVLLGDHEKGFTDYHNKDGHTVEKQCKGTTPSQEKEIRNQIMMRPKAGGPTCAINVSNVLNDSGVFNGIDGDTFFPGNLSTDFSNATINQ